MAKVHLADRFLSLFETDSVEEDPRDFSRYDAYLDTLAVIYAQPPETASLPTRPQRADVGNNPFEARPDYGDYFSQGDFAGGALQAFYHRPGRDETRFLSSEGFDPSEPGKLTHLNDTAAAATITAPVALAQADGLPFVAQGNVVYRGDGAFPGTWTSEDPHSTGTQDVTDLAAEGSRLYAALGTDGISVRSAAGSWTDDYVTGTVSIVAWVKDRLMCADGRMIYEITATGALPSALETLAEGWAFQEIWEAGPFIFAAAVNTDAGLSRIHAYGLNSDASAIEKKSSTAMPKGDLIYAGKGYLGRMFLGGGRVNASGGKDPILYEAIPSDAGDLQLLLFTAGEAGANDLSVRCFESLPSTVVFGWSTDDRVGLAAVELGRSAFFNHVRTTAEADVQVRDVMLFGGRLLFAVEGEGLYYEELDTPVASAELVTSIADWNTTGFKVWDLIEVLHDPLVVGTQVEIDYTQKHPDDGEWEEALESAIPGASGTFEYLPTSVTSRRLALRIRSTSSQGNAPVIRSYAVRSTPAPARGEYQMKRFIRLFDKDRKDKRAERSYIDPRAVRIALHEMLYTWVTLYEAGMTFRARVEAIADRPMPTASSETEGTALREAFMVELTLIGTREG